MNITHTCRNEGAKVGLNPNPAQAKLFKEYASYSATYLVMSPILHEKEDDADYVFLVNQGFLETKLFANKKHVDVTPQGQSFARANGIKLNYQLPFPKPSRYDESNY